MWLNFDENDIQLLMCCSPLIINDNNDDDDDDDGGGGGGAGHGREYHLSTTIINCLYVRSHPGSATTYRA